MLIQTGVEPHTKSIHIGEEPYIHATMIVKVRRRQNSENDQEISQTADKPVAARGRATQQVSLKIVSEYDQEIPRSQTADNPMAPQGRAAQPSRDTRKTN